MVIGINLGINFRFVYKKPENHKQFNRIKMKFLCVAIIFAVVACAIVESKNIQKPVVTISDEVKAATENWMKNGQSVTFFYLNDANEIIKNVEIKDVFSEPMKMLNDHSCLFSFCHHEFDCDGEHVHEDMLFNWCVAGKNNVTSSMSAKVLPVLKNQWENLANIKTVNMWGEMALDKPKVDEMICNKTI